VLDTQHARADARWEAETGDEAKELLGQYLNDLDKVSMSAIAANIDTGYNGQTVSDYTETCKALAHMLQ
jgi:hypothetical protein